MAWRPHGHARVSASAPSAWGVCDRDGMVHNLRDLIWEQQWRGPRLLRTGFLVCKSCLDVPQQQLRPRILPADPVSVNPSRQEQFSVEIGLQGFNLYTVPPPPYETSAPVYSKAYVLAQVAALSGVPTPGSLIDDSDIILRSQVAQPLVAGDPARAYLLIFNPTFLALAVSFLTASFGQTSSIVLSTGQALLWSSSFGTPISTGPMTIAGFDASSREFQDFITGASGSFISANNGNLLGTGVSSINGQFYYAWNA